MELALTRIYKYPFLKETKEYIKDSHISLNDIVKTNFSDVLDRGKRRIIDALDGKETAYDEPEREIFSYSIANIMLSCIKDEYLIRKYALSESKRIYISARKEDDNFIEKIAANLGVKSKKDDKPSEYKMHFTDYLRYSSKMKDPRWELINKQVHKGYVCLSKENFLRLLEEVYRRRINNNLPINIPNELCKNKEIEKDIGKIKDKLNKKKASFAEVQYGSSIGKVNKDYFPPCMKFLASEITEGNNVSHSGRFALTSFLYSIGMQKDEIMQIYRSAPDFSEAKTKYQVEHITGSNGTIYSCPSCSTMKTYGNCNMTEENKECRWAFSPRMQYYEKVKLEKKKAPAKTKKPMQRSQKLKGKKSNCNKNKNKKRR